MHYSVVPPIFRSCGFSVFFRDFSSLPLDFPRVLCIGGLVILCCLLRCLVT